MRYFVIIVCLLFAGSDALFSDEFLDMLNQRVTDEPSNGYHYYALALYYGKTGDYNASVKHIKTAYKLEPKSEAILFDMGNILLNAGNYGDALVYLKKYLKIHPDHIPTLIKIATAEIQSGNMNAVDDIVDKLKKRNVSDDILKIFYLQKGEYLFKKKQYFSAEREMNKVIDSSDTNLASRAYSTIGSIQAIQGRFSPAVKSLNIALTLDYTNRAAYYALAYLLESQGLFKKAAETWHLASTFTEDPEKKSFCTSRMNKMLERDKMVSSTTKPAR